MGQHAWLPGLEEPGAASRMLGQQKPAVERELPAGQPAVPLMARAQPPEVRTSVGLARAVVRRVRRRAEAESCILGGDVWRGWVRLIH